MCNKSQLIIHKKFHKNVYFEVRMYPEVVGCIFVQLFVYLLEQQNDSLTALLLFYYTMGLQRWHQCQCYLSSLVVILVHWPIGRHKQAYSCYCGGLSCNSSFCSRVQSTNCRQFTVRSGLLFILLLVYIRSLN